MTASSMYDIVRDRALAALAAVEKASPGLDDGEFAQLVIARERAVRALAETPADGLHQMAIKIYVLDCIGKDRDGYTPKASTLMSRSVHSDLDRLAPLV